LQERFKTDGKQEDFIQISQIVMAVNIGFFRPSSIKKLFFGKLKTLNILTQIRLLGSCYLGDRYSNFVM
jgi:hypothetical protein